MHNVSCFFSANLVLYEYTIIINYYIYLYICVCLCVRVRTRSVEYYMKY